jgi:hypothetical protein
MTGSLLCKAVVMHRTFRDVRVECVDGSEFLADFVVD